MSENFVLGTGIVNFIIFIGLIIQKKFFNYKEKECNKLIKEYNDSVMSISYAFNVKNDKHKEEIGAINSKLEKLEFDIWVCESTKKFSEYKIIYKSYDEMFPCYFTYKERSKKATEDGFKFLTTYAKDTSQELWVKE